MNLARTAAAELARIDGNASLSTQKARETLARLLIARKDFAGAEAVLLESHQGATERLSKRKITGANDDRSSITKLIALYEAWHTAEPDKGHDATAAEWKAKLPPAESSAEPSNKK